MGKHLHLDTITLGWMVEGAERLRVPCILLRGRGSGLCCGSTKWIVAGEILLLGSAGRFMSRRIGVRDRSRLRAAALGVTVSKILKVVPKCAAGLAPTCALPDASAP